MLDREALLRVIELEKPHFVVPEVEAIATDVLIEIENKNLDQSNLSLKTILKFKC